MRFSLVCTKVINHILSELARRGQKLEMIGRLELGLGDGFPGSAKANGREPKTGLGRVFNYKLGC